ncbi:hypothetical protein CgunFtcFv8_026322 [Champsocephalus gunnari]|uniref:Uncharacterized protein n=1 Tax=Champsocephalus gunnari TaxID=52237 RepID=A0AAN8CHB9_CHAGU|nr:hypothetical protein CgunFtcFv8_026322 [Champsocephalus gunnari]
MSPKSKSCRNRGQAAEDLCSFDENLDVFGSMKLILFPNDKGCHCCLLQFSSLSFQQIMQREIDEDHRV